MRILVLVIAVISCFCMFSGCALNDYSSEDESSFYTSDATANPPDLNVSDTQPVTDTAIVASRLSQIISQLFASRSIRASQTRIQDNPDIAAIRPRILAGVAIPDLKNAVISLTPSMPSVLQSFAAGGKIETIPNVNAFMNTYGLSSATLQLAIRETKAIAVNLAELTPEQASGNPLLEAALREAVPIVLENSAAVSDLANNWKGALSSPAASRMAQAFGVGVESQITVAVPAADSSVIELILLGASEFSQAKNASQEWENGNPADPDGESPEPAIAANMATAGANIANLDSTETAGMRSSVLSSQTGLPAKGELPGNQYREFQLLPWEESESSLWKPCSDQRFRNYIIYRVQLRYVPELNQKYLRIFTEGNFANIDSMRSDDRKNRGYFQHYQEITLEPVNSDNDYYRPSWLSLYQVAPASLYKDISMKDDPKVSRTDLGNNQYVRELSITDEGLQIENFRNYTRGKWKFRPYRFVKPRRVQATFGEKWEYDESNKMYISAHSAMVIGESVAWPSISSWKDMFFMDHMLAPPPFTYASKIVPVCQVVFSAAGDCEESQRFRLESIQGVRAVWKTLGIGDGRYHHDEAYSTKARHITVDFGQVYR